MFYTGDIIAIKVIEALGLGSQAISLEEILENLSQVAKLPNQSYSKRKFNVTKSESLQERSLILK